jgi:UV DNA damage endonuclease
MPISLGYACINTQLPSPNSTMRRATFDQKGLSYAGEIALKNFKTLLPIIEWNYQNKINLYRMSSDMMPWASEYQMEDLPQWSDILFTLQQIGDLAKQYKQRLTFHPGQFNCLASDKPNVIANSIVDLSIHGKLMDLMNLPQTPYHKINVHLGSACGGRHEYAMENFCRNFELLPDNVKSRLTIENDDKKGMFSTKMLYEGVYKRVGVPIVYDQHHHEIGPQDATHQEAITMAYETWGNIRPTCHLSNSKKEYEDSSVVITAHSDYIYKPFIDYGFIVDVVIEAKMKEQAVLNYRNKWSDHVIYN